MPLLQVKLIEEALASTEKKEIVTELADAMVSIKEQNSPSWAWVDIEDVLSDEMGDWRVGHDDRRDPFTCCRRIKTHWREYEHHHNYAGNQ